MARKKLKDIKFPDLPDTYYVPEIDDTLSVEGATADAKAVGDALDLKPDKTELEEAIDDLDERKANVDGYYETFTSGQTEQLIATEAITDTEPYIYRKTGGANDVGDRVYDEIVGGSVVWNQLAETPNNGGSANGLTWTFNKAEGTVTINGTATARTAINLNQKTLSGTGHVAFLCGCPSGGSTSTYSLQDGWGLSDGSNRYADTGTGFVGRKPDTQSKLIPQIVIQNGVVCDNLVFKPVFVDLTALLTPEPADYIYTLETATAGAGVAWFKKYFPGIYYGYCEPHFEHVQTSGKETVGFNQWDEEWVNGTYNAQGVITSSNRYMCSKNMIPVFPSTQYYLKSPDVYFEILSYDENKNYLRRIASSEKNRVVTMDDKTHFITFGSATADAYTTYTPGDICINLHGDRDGEYEPYKKRTYPLDSSLTLRGIPKLDSANRLYFDGDVYAHDGTVTRRYGIVDLGTLTWTRVEETRLTVGYEFSANLSAGKSGSVFRRNEKYPQIEDATGLTNILTIYGADINKVAFSASGNQIYIIDSAYSDAASFKTAMSGVYLVYELATPTTETAEPFQSPMVVDPLGTEEFVDYAVEQGERDVAIPVGHSSEYPADLRGKLQHLPSLSTSGDGRYVVVQTGNQMTLSPDTSLGLIAALEARVAALEGGNG